MPFLLEETKLGVNGFTMWTSPAMATFTGIKQSIPPFDQMKRTYRFKVSITILTGTNALKQGSGLKAQRVPARLTSRCYLFEATGVAGPTNSSVGSGRVPTVALLAPFP